MCLSRAWFEKIIMLTAWPLVMGTDVATSVARAADPAVQAVDFTSRVVYRSERPPGYACWVSFFPGEKGQWYIGCEEVSRPDPPLPRSSRQDWYEMMLPVGYDKSQYLMEAVILESRDDLGTWKEVSRKAYRHRHSVHQFAQARTTDGRFLRFIWSCYSLDPNVEPNEIHYESHDNGGTWKKMPPFHNEHFVSYPHRIRTLRDGTLVLCMPLQPRWGKGTDRPTRICSNPYTVNEMQMNIFFSFDMGRTWDGPLPIYGGTNVSETDFVELPDGDLLFINNSIFSNAGRQFVYRDGRRFTPGPLERVRAGKVPETVCLTSEEILVGCVRAGTYYWSDDLGQTWQSLHGAPSSGEVYQPWIHYLPDGRIACAGHNGSDTPISAGRQGENHINLNLFRLKVLRKTKDVEISVERVFDEKTQEYPNVYRMTLTSDGKPLPDKELEFKMDNETIKTRTDASGSATIAIPEKDKITDVHSAYGFVVRFNSDRHDPEYKPAQSQRFLFYAKYHQDPPLKSQGQAREHAKSSLHVTPCAHVTPEQIILLRRKLSALERDQSLFVEWSKIPNTLFKINFPESVVSLRNPWSTGFDYVRQLQWEPYGAGGWQFDVPFKTSDDSAAPIIAPYSARLRGLIAPAEDRIDLRLQFTNESQQTLEPQSLFICTGQNLGQKGDRVITADYFLRNGKFEPWAPQEGGYGFAPANIAALTEKGWQQYKWFKNHGYTPPVKEHPAADGCRAATIKYDGKDYVVALVSDDAVILGGKSSNPCQDLSLGFGPLKPDQSAEVSATWWFIEGTLEDLQARLTEGETHKTP